MIDSINLNSTRNMTSKASTSRNMFSPLQKHNSTTKIFKREKLEVIESLTARPTWKARMKKMIKDKEMEHKKAS